MDKNLTYKYKLIVTLPKRADSYLERWETREWEKRGWEEGEEGEG